MAYLVLADGSVYEGEAFGAEKQGVIGEVVFNTGMTGYQEVLTDPSYCGQIVMMTYPLIGNYGVNWEDPESHEPQVKGFIVRELCDLPSNWRSEGGLNDYLVMHGIMGLQGIDTRALTRKLRNHGVINGIICTELPDELKTKEMEEYTVEFPVDQVTCAEKFEMPGPGARIAVMDYGLKASILSSLRQRGCNLYVYPARTSWQEVMEDEPDGIMLTNGPGDPRDYDEITENLKNLIGKKPIFGICLGHQLLALATDATASKLKYGHRGSNHPVKDLKKNRVYITSQNHGYTIDKDSVTADMEVTHVNWNDQTIEGIKYKSHPSFSVQFHPEASPGPKDTGHLFDEFMELIEKNK